MIGLVSFSAFSLLCGFAVSDGMLIAARALQGAAAAILAPSVFSITTVTFEEDRAQQGAGILGAIAGSGAMIGVLLGGVLTEYIGWERIFYVNAPIGVLALFPAMRYVAESRLEGVERRFGHRRSRLGHGELDAARSHRPRTRAGDRSKRSAC